MWEHTHSSYFHTLFFRTTPTNKLAVHLQRQAGHSPFPALLSSPPKKAIFFYQLFFTFLASNAPKIAAAAF